jgi:hypothetical protein
MNKMKLVVNDYGQFVSASKSFGFVGPVFYYTDSGEFYACIITNGGQNRVQAGFNPQPSTFFTDFPNAVEVNFSQLTTT